MGPFSDCNMSNMARFWVTLSRYVPSYIIGTLPSNTIIMCFTFAGKMAGLETIWEEEEEDDILQVDLRPEDRCLEGDDQEAGSQEEGQEGQEVAEVEPAEGPSGGGDSEARRGIKRKKRQTGKRGKRPRKRNKPRAPRLRDCVIPDCNYKGYYVKWHTCNNHLPGVLEMNWDVDTEGLFQRRVEALNEMARMLGQEEQGRQRLMDRLQGLVERVNKEGHMKMESKPTQQEERHMREFSRVVGENWPWRFQLYPMEKVGALLHWRAVLSLMCLLGPGQRDEMMTKYWGLESGALLPGFDAHFHLDRSRTALNVQSWEELLNMTREDKESFRLRGACASYCDPSTWPTEEELVALPKEVLVAVGLHPKTVAEKGVGDKCLRELRELLHHPRVIALGEVGLDRSTVARLFEKQVEGLKKLLELLQPKEVQHKALVLHCRGRLGSVDHVKEYGTLRELLQGRVPRGQKIYLHCFQGNVDTVEAWLQSFPNTYFGFTRSVKDFTADQQEALRHVPNDRLLVETDAPYFPRHPLLSSSPTQVGDVIRLVAEVRSVNPMMVGVRTTHNAERVFGNVL